VQIPGKLTQAEFNAIHTAQSPPGTGGGAMTYVGYWNSNAFTWGGITFPIETLLFNGCNAQWVQENGVFVYYIRYSFTWRPNGWYVQTTIAETSGSTPAPTGLLTTEDIKVTGLTTAFNPTLFPV
jgi:hypothetical protein